jgi:hypothetical protein
MKPQAFWVLEVDIRRLRHCEPPQAAHQFQESCGFFDSNDEGMILQ